MESVLDMAVATISNLAESYTSGVSETVVIDEKDVVTFRADTDVYERERVDNSKRLEPSYPKEEEAASADGTEDSDEVLEVIG